MKFWIKTVVNEKITHDVVAESFENFSKDEFVTFLQDVCHNLDVPTPIFSQSDFVNLACFNSTKIKARDFVETVDFDFMEIEIVS